MIKTLLHYKFFNRGVIIVIAMLALAVLLLLGAYFLSFSLSESKISQSQSVSVKTYYLAEAGVNEAIWKLKNDSAWESGFKESPGCSNWQASFERNYSSDSTTRVSIKNSECARGEIIATSTVMLPKGKYSQRVVKVGVLKAIGSLTEDSPVFAGAPSGETTIQASSLNIYNGNMFINNTLNIKLWSTVNVYDNASTPELEGKVLTVGNENVSLNSALNANAECTKDICNTTDKCECSDPDKFQECTDFACPPKSLGAPAVDFDSLESYSYKSKAQTAQDQGQCSVIGKNSAGAQVLTSSNCIFSETNFSDLLWQVGEGGTLILEHKTNGTATSTYYVEGGIDLRGGRNLEINGVLIADKTVNIGEGWQWKGDSGFDQLTINDPGVGIPSGLLTKGKVNFGPYSSDINITGLLYSQDEMRLTSLPSAFNLTGGIIARKFSLTSAWTPVNIYLDNAAIKEGVWGGPDPPPEGGVPYSPIVTIEHWEETY